MQVLKRINLISLDFISAKRIDKVCDVIIETVKNKNVSAGRIPLLFTPNVDIIVKMNENKNSDLKEFLSKAEFILPDGQPIVWYSKFLGVSLDKRLTGSDIFPYLWKSINENNLPALFLTPNDVVSDYFMNNSKTTTCITLPFFKEDDNEAIENIARDCISTIKKENIRIIIMGLSFPKEDRLALTIYNDLKQLYDPIDMPYICLLGASMEFYLNLKKRANKFMQSVGLEWFYRFCTEPKRLFRRYFVDSTSFLSIIKNDYKTRA